MNGVNTSQNRRLDAFHEQLTVADRAWTAGPAAHAPTVVDVPLAAPPPP
ncbi:resuscitation-promoting factor, partial [Streptomyces sp. SID2119]|nr:resuscitation-promoting factor [Streptomyces sp. SID2119]